MSYQSRHSGAKIDDAVDQLATLTATAAASTASAANAAGSASTATTKAAEAAVSAANAAAVATGGTATLTPEAGKIPLAGADAQVAHGWVAPPVLPSSRPSLLLDFKKGHIDPRITFTRASAATYWDNQGVLRSALAGEPRIDHDPLTGACRGLLIEESRTNIILQSADPTQWTASEAISDGTVVAPNGASVPIWLASINAASHRLTRTGLSGAAGNLAHAASIFVYVPPSSDVIRLIFRARAGTDGQVVTASVAGSGATATFAFVGSYPLGSTPPAAIIATNFHAEHVGGGWHRLWYDSPLSATTTAASQVDVSFSCNAAEVAAGTANTRIAFWQGQLEAGSFATSPIITTSAAVTRAADLATFSGVNFSSWYRAAQGSLLAEWTNGSDIDGVYVMRLDDGTSTNNITIIAANTGNTTGQYASVSVGGVAQANVSTGAVAVAGAVNRLAVAYALNDFAASRNGLAISTDNLGTVPSVNRLQIGNGSGTTQQLNGHIARLAYYPKRLSNAELVALSAA